MVTTSYNVMILALFTLGLCATARAQISIIYLFESIQKVHFCAVFTTASVIEGLFGISGSLYFLYVSKNWFYLLFVAYIVQLLATIGAFFIPESPKFLISSGQYERAAESLQVIAAWNKTNPCFATA